MNPYRPQAALRRYAMRRWAIDYHADGFRFDLMGHLPKATVERAKVGAASTL